MSEPSVAPIQTWLTAPMKHDVSEAIERLRRARDVQQIAVMPDVHLATDVCIGVVVATSQLIFPQAVGGDIGCGMLAVGFDSDRSVMTSTKHSRARPPLEAVSLSSSGGIVNKFAAPLLRAQPVRSPVLPQSARVAYPAFSPDVDADVCRWGDGVHS